MYMYYVTIGLHICYKRYCFVYANKNNFSKLLQYKKYIFILNNMYRHIVQTIVLDLVFEENNKICHINLNIVTHIRVIYA